MRKYFGILLILWAIAGCLSTPRGTGGGNAPGLTPGGEGGEQPSGGPADERLSDTPPVAFPGNDETPRDVKPPLDVYCEGRKERSELQFERKEICELEAKPEWAKSAVSSPDPLGEPEEVLTVIFGLKTDESLGREGASRLISISPPDLVPDQEGHQIQADEDGRARFEVSAGTHEGVFQIGVKGSKGASCGSIRVGVCPIHFDPARPVPMKEEEDTEAPKEDIRRYDPGSLRPVEEEGSPGRFWNIPKGTYFIDRDAASKPRKMRLILPEQK